MAQAWTACGPSLTQSACCGVEQCKAEEPAQLQLPVSTEEAAETQELAIGPGTSHQAAADMPAGTSTPSELAVLDLLQPRPFGPKPGLPALSRDQQYMPQKLMVSG